MVTAPQLLSSLVVGASGVGVGYAANCSSSSDGAAVLKQVAEASLSFIQSDATWLLFADPPLDLTCTAGGSGGSTFELVAVGNYVGTVRLALANNCTTGTNARFCSSLARAPPRSNPPTSQPFNDADQSLIVTARALCPRCRLGEGEEKDEWVALLRSSAGRVATGGAVSFTDTELSFKFATAAARSGGGEAEAELLTLGMPHHYSHLASDERGARLAADEWAAGHRSILGWSRPVLGDSWLMTLPNSSIFGGFEAARRPVSLLYGSKTSSLLRSQWSAPEAFRVEVAILKWHETEKMYIFAKNIS